MDDLNELRKTVSDFQMAQLTICNAIVELLIDKRIISADEAAQKFRAAAEDTGRSNVGLVGAEIVLSMVEFLEDRHPEIRKAQRPS